MISDLLISDNAVKKRTTAPGAPADEGAGGGKATPTDYEAVHRTLNRCVKDLCPDWIAGWTDDIVVDSELRVIKARGLDPHAPGVPFSYLRRVARTAIMDQARTIRRRRSVPLEGTPAASSALAVDPDPMEVLSLSELREGVDEGLAQLSWRRRVVVELRLGGCSVHEVMQRTGWSHRKVRNLLFRGLLTLRRHLLSKGLAPAVREERG